VRLQKALTVTGSFKYVKTHLKKEGFDPRNMQDPLYLLDGDARAYVPVTGEVYERIQRCELSL